MFAVFVTAFFTLIDRSYLHTFTTTMTAPQYCAETYKAATTDFQRLNVLTKHPSYYASVEGDLAAFVATNWAAWQADKPDWFTADVVATIPDRFIPVAELAMMNAAAGGQRRRSSLGDVFGGRGSARESASVAPMLDE